MYKLFKELTALSKPGEKSFDELKQAVNAASSKSTPKYDSQTFQVQFTCKTCK